MAKQVNGDTKIGDELVTRIRDAGISDRERTTATMELLSRLFAGYDIRRIAPLLRSENTNVVRAGTFLAAELSDRAGPLLNDIGRLLANSDPWVRHDAIQVILAAGTARDARLVAKAIGLIDDTNPAIRRDVMQLLASADSDVLRGSIDHLDSRLASFTRLLIDDASNEVGDPARDLADPDAMKRRFAAIAIVRLTPANTILLAEAARSNDPDVSAFARTQQRSKGCR
ncbi:hypothetical protein [Nocardia sp. NPDC058666]|uniref:hypothetical protein n=1 Tax=Nocardia sp. NPDC058666 TaxID=3346587 RepID=UPI0036609D4D